MAEAQPMTQEEREELDQRISAADKEVSEVLAKYGLIQAATLTRVDNITQFAIVPQIMYFDKKKLEERAAGQPQDRIMKATA